MGYLHINNLYKDQKIMLFKECYALEKIHGTSAHIQFVPPVTQASTGRLAFSSGGESHARFVGLFDEPSLFQKFIELGIRDREVIVYGEAYGGKQQGMSGTYGKDLKFAAFDVKIGNNWLDVLKAEEVCKSLGIEFVYYTKIPVTVEALNAARDADSQQAIRNGVGPGKKMEGVVLRPLIELTLNNGDRVISKHKRDEFMETATPRSIEVDPAKLKLLADAEAIANEWVTTERMRHVVDKIPGHAMEKMPVIINAMLEDVFREGKGEVVDSKEARKAISNRTVKVYKELLTSQIK